MTDPSPTTPPLLEDFDRLNREIVALREQNRILSQTLQDIVDKITLLRRDAHMYVGNMNQALQQLDVPSPAPADGSTPTKNSA